MIASSKFCPRCKNVFPLTQDYFRTRSEKPHLVRPYCRKCDRAPYTPHPRPPCIVNGMKTCRLCKQALPISGFNKNGRYIRSYCKSCATKKHLDWVRSNKSAERAIAKRCYDKNRERIIAREIERDHRLRTDPILGPRRRAQYNAMAAKRRTDPTYIEKIRAWDRNYAKTEIGRARYWRRRARKAKAPGEFTLSDLSRIVGEQGEKCFWCGVDIVGRVVADHYIPLSRGGSNWPSNIVASCGRCNSRKHNKLPEEFAAHLAMARSGDC